MNSIINSILTDGFLVFFLNVIGASTKWLVYLGKKSFKVIWKEEWNGRLGVIVCTLIAIGTSIILVIIFP